MDQKGQPDAIHLLIIQLNEALNIESNYQPLLELPTIDQNPSDSITAGIRDGSAHVLRCLKVWYDLPSEVLFVAINVMDRFLTKMKAQPKHMACISVASFQLAVQHFSQHQPITKPEPCDLVTISQCKCTLGDVARMEGIIARKLEVDPRRLPVTPLDFLRLFDALFGAVADRLGLSTPYGRAMVVMPTAWLSLEIVACDAACSNFRPCEVALVLVCSRLDEAATEPRSGKDPSGSQLGRLLAFGVELQKLCNISDSSYLCCQEVVLSILARYNAQCQMPHRQRLQWRLSQRTLRYLRPTDKLTSTLPTINEHAQLQILLRTRSGSMSSEESCDSEKEEILGEWNQEGPSPTNWSKGDMFPMSEEDDDAVQFIRDLQAA